MKHQTLLVLILVGGVLAFSLIRRAPRETPERLSPAVAAASSPAPNPPPPSSRTAVVTNQAGAVFDTGTPVLASRDSALGRFEAWSQRYLATPAHERARLETEGLRLAGERRSEFKRLIAENPREALRQAMPMSVRQQLPVQIVSEMEQRVNRRADLRVYHGDPLPGETIPKDLIVYRVAAFNDGTALVANVYGRRALDMFGARNDSQRRI